MIGLPRRSDGQPTNVTLRAVTPQRLRGARRDQDRRRPQLHARPRRGDRRAQADRSASRGSSSAATSSTSRSWSRSSGSSTSEGARLRERDLGRLRHVLGAIFQRGGGTQLAGGADEGPGHDPRARPLRSAPSRRCSCRRSRERKYYEEQAGPLAASAHAPRRLRVGHDGHRRRVRRDEHDVRDRRRPARARSARCARSASRGADPVLVRDRVRDPGARRRRDRLPAGVPDERLLDRHRPDRRASARSPSPSASRPRSCCVGMAFAVVMGIIGGLLPALRAARLPITSALREA